jgi:D,D-heptose 1,7-bisphosphate phosphatase
MKTVIMAGGKGTRIASVTVDIPKPMIKLVGKPILEYQIECLKKYNLTDIIIVIGHLGSFIKEYFGDGARFGCSISYYEETIPLGTAGALYKIKNMLGDDFILLCGDIVFDIDFERFIGFHKEKDAHASLATHPNSHPYDSSLLVTDNDNRVIRWLNKEDERHYYKNIVNSGLHILNKAILECTITGNGKIDLDRDVLKPNITNGRVFAYSTPEYIKDMGTPERYEQVSCDIQSGLVKNRNLSQQQKAVFLDRDGTINETNGFVTKPEDFRLIPGAAEAIKRINSSGYLAIVTTNQPVIARGEASLNDLDAIHKKMETLLGDQGAYLDDIFYCPHHPDKGFAGERPEYKINCECRKPKPGMILNAAKKYNINLAASWMVGDSKRDVGAGICAGCKTAYINHNVDNEQNFLCCKSLYDFVNRYISGSN